MSPGPRGQPIVSFRVNRRVPTEKLGKFVCAAGVAAAILAAPTSLKREPSSQ